MNYYNDYYYQCSSSIEMNEILTLNNSKPFRLVVMNDGNTDGVERHQTEDYPIEAVGFNHATNRYPQHAFLAPQVSSGPSSRCPYTNPRAGAT